MGQPQVSIIMGIYNCETSLSVAIDSILQQSYLNWELIMCDDGSTDDTVAIAKIYAERHDNIKLICNERNMKLAYTLNRCLQHVHGLFVARMDADDSCVDSRIEKQVSFLLANPKYDAVGCAMYVCSTTNRAYVRLYPQYPMESLVWSSTPFAHPTVMIKKSVFDSLGGYRTDPITNRAEDLDLWFRFKIAGYHGYNIQEPLYSYHEDITDYSKRTTQAAFGCSRLIWHYYRRMKIPFKYYYLVVKPLISTIMPAKAIMWYHQTKGHA